MNAEGWYCDPYGRHQDRWFSDGHPTRLVRDDGTESADEPPSEPPPQPLVECQPAEVDGRDSDLRRAADNAGGGQSVSGRQQVRAVIDDAEQHGYFPR